MKKFWLPRRKGKFIRNVPRLAQTQQKMRIMKMKIFVMMIATMIFLQQMKKKFVASVTSSERMRFGIDAEVAGSGRIKIAVVPKLLINTNVIIVGANIRY